VYIKRPISPDIVKTDDALPVTANLATLSTSSLPLQIRAPAV
jgi:hypothetical protein